MKERKVGIITLALTLIGLGIILTVHNVVPIALGKTLQILAGVSIIVLGVEFIWTEAANRRRDEHLRLRMSGLCIFILITIYIVSTALPFIPFSMVIENGNVVTNGFTFFGNHNLHDYTYQSSYTEDAEGVQGIVVHNRYGDISIVPTESSTITIGADIRVSLMEADEEQAKAISDDAIKIEKFNNTMRISTIIPKKNASVSIDYIIQVPSFMLAEVTNQNGEINIEGIKQLDVINKYGDINIKNIANEVAVENKNGKVSVSDVGSTLTISNQYGNINAESIDGDTTIDNKNGKVKVLTIGGDLTISNQYENIEFVQVTGKVTIEFKNGKIKGSKVGNNVNIDATYAEIDLDEVHGNVEIDNSYEEIAVIDIKGSVDINTKNGNVIGKRIDQDVKVITKYSTVELEDIAGNVKVETTNNNIDLIKIGGDLDVDIKYGDVRLDNSNTLLHNASIDNENGNVTLNLPDHQEGKFNIYSKYGKIRTNNGLAIEEESSNEQTATGRVGDSDNSIYIEAGNGNVTIE